VQDGDARVIVRAAQVSAGELLTIRFADDQLQATAGDKSSPR
jgi:hypothetical protein